VTTVTSNLQRGDVVSLSGGGVEVSEIPADTRGNYMRAAPLLVGFLTAGLIAGCGKRSNETGTTGGGMSSDTMQTTTTPSVSDTGTGAMDTTGAGAAGGMASTARTGARMHPDTSSTTGKNPTGKKTSSTGKANPNQTKSGVTDTKTGKSTLGPGATKTSPDQGQPVTAKGDTLSGDSASSSNR
jgi:hypothetical protein